MIIERKESESKKRNKKEAEIFLASFFIIQIEKKSIH